jgi:hypothetical protein
MKNQGACFHRAMPFAGAMLVVGCLAMLLYVFSPTLGRAFTKKGVSSSSSSIGMSRNPRIPGGAPLLW